MVAESCCTLHRIRQQVNRKEDVVEILLDAKAIVPAVPTVLLNSAERPARQTKPTKTHDLLFT